MKPQRNKFEMAAHDAQFKVHRPSWEHTIETYTEGKKSSHWPMTIFSIVSIIGFLVVLFTKF